jgi:hypothetical protein
MIKEPHDISSLWEQYPGAAQKLEEFASRWIGALQQIQASALENMDTYIPELTHEIKKNTAIVLVRANARLLLDFFDTEGIFIQPAFISLKEPKDWGYCIHYRKEGEWTLIGEEKPYTHRVEAEAAAYEEAFKILEELL